MSTMPPISSLGSAPLMSFSSPAFSTPAIQSRKSLFATSELLVSLHFCFGACRRCQTFLAHPRHAYNCPARGGDLPGAERKAVDGLAPPHHDDFEPIDREIHQRLHDRQNGDRGHHDVHLEDLTAVLDQITEPERRRLELADDHADERQPCIDL